MLQKNEKKIKLFLKSIDIEFLIEIFESLNWNNEKISEIAPNYIVEIFQYLKNSKQCAEVFTYFNIEIKKKILEIFSDEQLFNILDNLENDEIINLLERVNSKNFKRILNLTDAIDRKKINQLLQYNKNFAGSIMSNDYLSFKRNDLIKDVILKIKNQNKYSNRDNFYYVVNSENKLIGQISLRAIFFAKSNKTVKEIISKVPVDIKAIEDKEEVSIIFKKYDLNEAPVVDNNGHLVGVIYFDEIYDVASEEAREDFQKIMAIDPFTESYLKAKPKKIIKSRVTWLLILLFSATLSQVVIQLLQNTIASSEITHFFVIGGQGLIVLYIIDSLIPLISGTAGNTGSQSSTSVIRGIAMGHIETKDYKKLLFREFKISIGIALSLIFLNAIRMIIYDVVYNQVKFSNPNIFQYDWLIIIAISLSLFFSVCISQVVGITLPVVIRKFKKDPSVMSAPLITTLVDALCNGITYSLCIGIFVLFGGANF